MSRRPFILFLSVNLKIWCHINGSTSELQAPISSCRKEEKAPNRKPHGGKRYTEGSSSHWFEASPLESLKEVLPVTFVSSRFSLCFSRKRKDGKGNHVFVSAKSKRKMFEDFVVYIFCLFLLYVFSAIAWSIWYNFKRKFVQKKWQGERTFGSGSLELCYFLLLGLMWEAIWICVIAFSFLSFPYIFSETKRWVWFYEIQYRKCETKCWIKWKRYRTLESVSMKWKFPDLLFGKEVDG